MSRKIITTLILTLLISGCAQMFTAKTKASYIRPDGTRIEYESDKEQIGLDADFDPVTGKFHIKVDKAGTLESVVAATMQTQIMLNQLIQTIGAGVKTGALAGS